MGIIFKKTKKEERQAVDATIKMMNEINKHFILKPKNEKQNDK